MSLTTLLAIMKYMSRPKSAAAKDIIDIVDILGQKYRYRIDIGKDDINPPLTHNHMQSRSFSNAWEQKEIKTNKQYKTRSYF